MARPTKLDEIIIKKLEEAFIIGASIKEAYSMRMSRCRHFIARRPEILNLKMENSVGTSKNLEIK